MPSYGTRTASGSRLAVRAPRPESAATSESFSRRTLIELARGPQMLSARNKNDTLICGSGALLGARSSAGAWQGPGGSGGGRGSCATAHAAMTDDGESRAISATLKFEQTVNEPMSAAGPRPDQLVRLGPLTNRLRATVGSRRNTANSATRQLGNSLARSEARARGKRKRVKVYGAALIRSFFLLLLLLLL